MVDELERLTEQFRQLGARDPEIWARSQIREGINQLHRYLFLRQAWKLVVGDADERWIDAETDNAARHPGKPFSGIGKALGALLDAGADRRLLTEVVRGKQAELLFGLCYLLEDPGIDEDSAAHIGWRLVETGPDGEPTGQPISGLHESVLETDPSGREMRPREE